MICNIKTSLPIEFEIRKAVNVLSLSEITSKRKIVIIDRNVYELYSDQLFDDVDSLLFIDSSEENKDWTTAEMVLTFLEENKILRRSEPVIAIGGGVLLDLVGFCCSIYRRGIPYIRIPTTLLAIVDASVGAKTSVNHFNRRNRLGSFYPPQLTLIDTTFIKTQSDREISNGFAEILKLAIVLDSKLFELIETDSDKLLQCKFQDTAHSTEIIERAIAGMTKELNDNLWEQELERPVDFGHSFSPLIEMKNVPNLLHGEAVILDCLLSCCISTVRNLLSADELTRIFNLTRKMNLPVTHTDFLNSTLLLEGLSDVMKHRNGNQYLPIPTSIGQCKIINDLTPAELESAIQLMRLYEKDHIDYWH